MRRSGTFLLWPAASRMSSFAPSLTLWVNEICLPRRSRRAFLASAPVPLISPTTSIIASFGKFLVAVLTFIT
eukprot:5683004-Prymnesium_polylepis.1